jgi:hypothetical protein
MGLSRSGDSGADVPAGLCFLRADRRVVAQRLQSIAIVSARPKTYTLQHEREQSCCTTRSCSSS